MQQDNDGDEDKIRPGITPAITAINNTQVQNQTLTRNINFVAGRPQFATNADQQMVNQVAARAPNSSTSGPPVITTNGNTTTTTTTTRQVRSIITIDLMANNQANWNFNGTTAPQLQTNRYNLLRRQLINQGVPAGNIRRGRTVYGVPPAQMGGNPNQTDFRVRTTRTSTTTGSSSTTN